MCVNKKNDMNYIRKDPYRLKFSDIPEDLLELFDFVVWVFLLAAIIEKGSSVS